MLDQEIIKEFDEKFDNLTCIEGYGTEEVELFYPREDIHTFLLQSLARQREVIRDILEKILKEREEIEKHHQEMFNNDEIRFRINPSKENKDKMLMYESGLSQYGGGLADGEINTLKLVLDLLN